MALVEIETLEQDAIDTIINLIETDTLIKSYTKRQKVKETEDLRVVAYGAKYPLIQIKDPSWNFITPHRDKYSENPFGYVQIAIYNSLTETKQGEALKGHHNNVGIRKVIGRLLRICNGSLIDNPVNGFYWLMINSISTGEPIFIKDYDEESDDFETIFYKVMLFEIRKKISMT